MSEIKEWVSEYEEEKNSNKNQTDLNSLLNRAKSDFIEEGFSKDWDFLDIEDEHFDSVAFDNFLVYLEWKNSYSILATELAWYSDIQKQSIKNQLKQDVLKNTIKNKKNIDTLKDIYKEEFKIKSWEDIEKKLKKLKSYELTDLLNSELKRRKFIDNNYNKNEYEEIDNTEDFLKEINIEWIDISKLEKWQQEAILKFKETQDLNNIEFLHFLSVFNKDQKIAILKFFKVSISLFDLIKESIVNKDTAKSLLEKTIKNSYPKLEKTEIKNFVNNWVSNDILLKDIKLSIEELENLWDKEIKNLLRNKEVLSNLSEKISEKEMELEEWDLNDKLKLDERWNIHQKFIDLVKTDHRNVWDKTRSTIENFSEWNYIKIRLNWKDSYFQVWSTELWKDTIESKLFKIKNLASPFGDWLLKPDQVNEDSMAYEKLYEVFKNANKQKWAEVEFIDKKEFNENWNLNFIDSKENISSQEDLKDKLISNWNLDENLRWVSLNELCFLDDTDEKKGDYVPFYRYFQAVTNDWLVFEGSNQKMSFSDFFTSIEKWWENNNWYKKYKFERKIFSSSDIFEKEPLSDIALHKDWKKLVDKSSKNESWAWEIKLFKSWNQWLYVHEASDWKISYSLWTIKKENKWKFYSKEEKAKWKKDKISSTTYNFKDSWKWSSFENYNDFILHIKEFWFSAVPVDWVLIETEEEKKQKKLLDSKWWFFGKMFNNASITELIQWWKMLVDAVEQHLEHWNKLRASKFAEKFWKILPNSISSKLRSTAEKETNELIEKRIWMWKDVWSDVATVDIERNILLNPNAEDHDILAAVQYMVEKNWTLYAKALNKYRPWPNSNYSDHLWFIKLWWTKEQFLKEKAKITKANWETIAGRDDPEIFSEEKLLMSVLWDWAKSGRFPSKTHKNFWWKVETGHKKRMEKWVEETSTYYTASDKVEYALGYLWKWEWSRFLWAMEKTFWKDSDRYSMNVMPFVLWMSWLTRTWHSGQVMELHKLDWTTAYPTLEMMKSDEWVELYQEAIHTFLKASWNEKQSERLKELKNPINKSWWDSLHKFFMDNNKLLTDFITLKDWFAATRRDDHPILWQFYDRITDKLSDGEYALNEDSLKARTYEESAFADSKGKLDNITLNNDWTLRDMKSKRLIDIYWKRLQYISKLPSDKKNKNIWITDEHRKKLWLNVFEPFMGYMDWPLSWHYEKYSKWDIDKFYRMDTAKRLKNYGLLLPVWEDDIDKIWKETFLEKAYQHSLNWSWSSVWNVNDEVSDAMKDILEWKVVNNPDYEPVEDEKVA